MASHPSGAAYVFTGNNYNYSLLNKLDKSGISGLSFFGYSLSINKNGNILAVGDLYCNVNSGAFFIYTGDRNNNFKQVFVSGFRGPGQAQLGASLKLNNEGNTLIVGLPTKDYPSGEINIITGSNNIWNITNIINQKTLDVDALILGLPVDLSSLSGKNTYYAGNYIYQMGEKQIKCLNCPKNDNVVSDETTSNIVIDANDSSKTVSVKINGKGINIKTK